jgi:hypothetical protein
VTVVNAAISKNLEYMPQVEGGRSPEEGEFGYSLLCANEGKRGVGVYFRTGKVGFVLPVGDSQHCYKLRASTLQEFIASAQKNHGLMLTGGTWDG